MGTTIFPRSFSSKLREVLFFPISKNMDEEDRRNSFRNVNDTLKRAGNKMSSARFRVTAIRFFTKIKYNGLWLYFSKLLWQKLVSSRSDYFLLVLLPLCFVPRLIFHIAAPWWLNCGQLPTWNRYCTDGSYLYWISLGEAIRQMKNSVRCYKSWRKYVLKESLETREE